MKVQLGSEQEVSVIQLIKDKCTTLTVTCTDEMARDFLTELVKIANVEMHSSALLFEKCASIIRDTGFVDEQLGIHSALAMSSVPLSAMQPSTAGDFLQFYADQQARMGQPGNTAVEPGDIRPARIRQ